MKWFIKCFKQYADFKGRSRRTEFWMFKLVLWSSYLVGMFLFLVVLADVCVEENLSSALFYVWAAFICGTAIPALAVTVRRLHDAGYAGWCILICLIPHIGWLVLLIFCCQDSQPGVNKYGPNPKDVDVA